MTNTSSGHMPENLTLGAVLSSLSFFCTAVMSALVKATGNSRRRRSSYSSRT
jgi:hypothetical protein